MDISYLGHSSFKIKGKTAILITDPFDSKMVGLKYPKVSADIVTISHNHADHNFSEAVVGDPFIISEPGEYEVKDISITGLLTYHDSEKGEKKGENIIYLFDIDGLKLLHLGDLGHKLSDKMVESLGDIDILLVPVGGFYTIEPEIAFEVVQSIEPSIVIPMHYKTAGMSADLAEKLKSVDDFLKDSGLLVEKTEKLSIKKEELAEDQKIVLLDIKN